MAHLPRFVKSALGPETYPIHEGLEFAFLGASNSGKSTLVNALLGAKLCKTSSKPGHTSLLNFFAVKKGLYFVDLPGYGFAKKSQKEQKKWQKAIEAYLAGRPNLALCYVLFDLKRGLLQNDVDLLDWLDHEGIPFALLATKTDKLNQKERSKAVKTVQEQGVGAELIQASALKGQGVKEIWAHIEALREVSASQTTD